jgi:hypothetical protein
MYNTKTLNAGMMGPICTAKNPIPAFLQVCLESREDGLKYYSVLETCAPNLRNEFELPNLPRQLQPGWVTQQPPFHIYFSSERDTLYFTRWNTYLERRYGIRNHGLQEKFMPKTIAIDLDSSKDDFRIGQVVQMPPAETFILVLPTC